MGRRIFVIISVVVAIFLSTSFSFSAPNLINYQGTLTDGAGQPIAGSVSIEFRLYDAATNGNQLWAETQNVTLQNGTYNVLLGVVPFPADLFFNDNLWLEVIAAGETLTPRQQMVGVPYAIKSGCDQGDIILCYTGPEGTVDIGECRTGRRFCRPEETGYDACVGDVVPGQEVCDGLDNDCNSIIDDDATDATSWYADTDQDGFGDPANEVLACVAPPGFIAETGDCDDSDPASYPGAAEICADGIDNDCNAGTPDIYDADNDLYTCDVDCDDGNQAINPAAVESCDSEDNNCNGLIDEQNASGCLNYYLDSDRDGYGGLSTPACYCSPGLSEASATPDYYDTPSNLDCNDNDVNVNPAAEELCSTVGIDDDCDGQTDELNAFGCSFYYYDFDNDGYGTSDFGCLCAPVGNYRALATGDCNDSNDQIYPGAAEVCNGLDDNCNSSIDQAEVPVSTLCPSVPNATEACNGVLGCQVDSCDLTWFNIDGSYANGCEVQQDYTDRYYPNDSCATSYFLASLATSSPQNTTVSGNIVPTGDADWSALDVIYSSSSYNTLRISFTANPGGALSFDVYNSTCDPGSIIASNVTNFDYPNILSTRRFYVKVYRLDGSASVDNYTLRLETKL